MSVKGKTLLHGWRVKVMQILQINLTSIKEIYKMLSTLKLQTQFSWTDIFSEDLISKHEFLLKKFSLTLFHKIHLLPSSWWAPECVCSNASKNGHHILTLYVVSLQPKILPLCNPCSVWLLCVKFNKKAERKRSWLSEEKRLIISAVSQWCNGK